MSYNAQMVAFLAAFGLTAKSKLPVEGAAPRDVCGFKMWIEPLEMPNPTPWKRNKHRVKVECPNCHRIMSAGRLHQHVCRGNDAFSG